MQGRAKNDQPRGWDYLEYWLGTPAIWQGSSSRRRKRDVPCAEGTLLAEADRQGLCVEDDGTWYYVKLKSRH